MATNKIRGPLSRNERHEHVLMSECSPKTPGAEVAQEDALTILSLDDALIAMSKERDSFKKALEDIRDEQVLSGDPLQAVEKYNNPLTASMRNIAIEALEGLRP